MKVGILGSTQVAQSLANAGTTKLHRLEESIGAAAVELTTDDLRKVETGASKITVQGVRYPEQAERMTGR
jgi:aryl-alcohol dehydrogenase-like predicted oxidoreductase